MDKKISEFIDSKRDDIINDIRALVRIASVRSDASDGCPFGEKCAEALNEGTAILKKLNLDNENYDNYVITASLNNNETKLGVLAHLDVVEALDGWSCPPFDVTVKGDKIIGRGTADDKGPAVAAMYAFHAVKTLYPNLKYNARLILGSAEETGSEDIAYYFKKNSPPPAVFSPDADYPLINTEKGRFVPEFFAQLSDKSTEKHVVSFFGGVTSNVVPRIARAVVHGIDFNKCLESARIYSKKTGAEITCSENADGDVEFISVGKNAHAAQPETGINAQTALISLLTSFDIDSDSFNKLSVLNDMFPHGETDGNSAGIKSDDKNFGSLTCSFGTLKIENNTLSGTLDIRFPTIGDGERIKNIITDKFKYNSIEIKKARLSEVHHTPADSPFVKELLNVYEDCTGKKGECLAIGGGTYVHGIDGGVAFGCAMPGVDNRMHGADEFSYTDDLISSAKMFAEVIYDICSGRVEV